MSLWSRVRNAFRGDSLSREILEEYEAHLADAVADGLPPAEARRQFGRPLGLLEASRDFRLLPRLDSLRGDVVFAWRQLKKNKVTSLAAVLSIGLAMGACARDLRGIVLKQGLLLALEGTLLGLAVAALLVPLVAGIDSEDPAVWMCVSLLLVGVAMAACTVPARRAAQVGPLTALRWE